MRGRSGACLPPIGRMLEHLLGGLFHIVLADGRLCAAEDEYLREVARLFGFSSRRLRRIRAHMPAPMRRQPTDHGPILGVEPGVSPEAPRIAYHRRCARPPLLTPVIAQGLPPECIALATARAARIYAAYGRRLS